MYNQKKRQKLNHSVILVILTFESFKTENRRNKEGSEETRSK